LIAIKRRSNNDKNLYVQFELYKKQIKEKLENKTTSKNAVGVQPLLRSRQG
jgi:hypothetical protein